MKYLCFPQIVAPGVQANFRRAAAIHGSHIDWKWECVFQSGMMYNEKVLIIRFSSFSEVLMSTLLMVYLTFILHVGPVKQKKVVITVKNV